jgi:hypothetical protein
MIAAGTHRRRQRTVAQKWCRKVAAAVPATRLEAWPREVATGGRRENRKGDEDKSGAQEFAEVDCKYRGKESIWQGRGSRQQLG